MDKAWQEEITQLIDTSLAKDIAGKYNAANFRDELPLNDSNVFSDVKMFLNIVSMQFSN